MTPEEEDMQRAEEARKKAENIRREAERQDKLLEDAWSRMHQGFIELCKEQGLRVYSCTSIALVPLDTTGAAGFGVYRFQHQDYGSINPERHKALQEHVAFLVEKNKDEMPAKVLGVLTPEQEDEE